MITPSNRLLRTIWRQPVDATPIWIMRQAGRYLPEYRQIRQQAGSFMQLCQNPELACTVTLQPILRFPLDAAIIFSDILIIPDAMGLGLHFKEGEGPYFDHPVRSIKQIEQLHFPEPETGLSYVLDAIRLVRHELAGKIPLIGFCGSPWTLATYMIQGQSKPSFPLAQQMLENEPAALQQLLTKLADAAMSLLNAQIKAGADVVMIFDTWGGLLSTANYQNFSLQYIQKIIQGLITEVDGKRIPVILFTKNGGKWLDIMSNTGCHVLGVDNQIDLADARRLLNDKVALQGNMRQDILTQSPEIICQETARILSSYGAGPGHIFNLAHGITPDIPPENVAVLVDAVHTLSKPYHQDNPH